MADVIKSCRYLDKSGNTYHVEQAHNKKWVVMRYNMRGHRKLYKNIPPSSRKTDALMMLHKESEHNGWDEV